MDAITPNVDLHSEIAKEVVGLNIQSLLRVTCKEQRELEDATHIPDVFFTQLLDGEGDLKRERLEAVATFFGVNSILLIEDHEDGARDGYWRDLLEEASASLHHKGGNEMTETGDQSYDALYTGAQLGKHLAALARKAGKYTSIKLDGNALYGVHFQAIESGEIILPAQDVANFAEAVELRGQHTQTESYLAIATFLEDWTRSGVRATESSVAQPSPDSANDESELNEDDKREEETMIVGTEDGSTSNDLHVIDESVLEAGQQPAKAALGERLRAMADLLGTTYSKVNEAAGRPNLLSLLPNGNGSIGVEHLRALAAYFDVSVAFLFKSGNPTLEELQNERRRVSFEEDTSDADQQAPDQHDTGHGVSIINEAGDGVAQSGHVPTDADATGGDNEDAVVETVQSSAADDQGDAEEQVCKADDDIMYRDLFFRLARGQGDSLASRLLELLQRSSAGESIDWRAEVFGISDKLISLSEQISQLQASDPDLFEEVAEMTIREFASISSS